MSQEKVDRYKQEKVNRKQIMRKQKLMNNMRKGVLVVVALALIDGLVILLMISMSREKRELSQR